MMSAADDAEIQSLSVFFDMPIPAEYRAGVLAQWRLNQKLATPLLAVDLPEDAAPAPVFRP